jgi:LacI family transcriptional regulator
MKDVARTAGVSTATVSHVLNGTRLVQPETRDRVLHTIRELDYERDDRARRLRGRSTYTIAFIVPDLTNPLFPELATYVQEVAVRAGYDVVIYSTDVPHGGDQALFHHYIRAIRQKRYDAVIVAETAPTAQENREQLIATGVPVVLIGAIPNPATDRVYIEDYPAALEIMAHLVARGHTKIAHIIGVPGMRSASERLRGYRDGLKEAGLPLDSHYEVQGTFLREGGRRAMTELLSRSTRPTAVFAANDLTAAGAMQACFAAGLRIPEDVALVGFDDSPVATDVHPQLTTVYHGQREIGSTAAELAISRARNERPSDRQTIIVPHKLLVRDSS